MVVTNDWQWLKTQIILIKQIWETHFLFYFFFLSFIDCSCRCGSRAVPSALLQRAEDHASGVHVIKGALKSWFLIETQFVFLMDQ